MLKVWNKINSMVEKVYCNTMLSGFTIVDHVP